MAKTENLSKATAARPIHQSVIYEPEKALGKFTLDFIRAASEELLFEILRKCQELPEGYDIKITFQKNIGDSNLPFEGDDFKIPVETVMASIKKISAIPIAEFDDDHNTVYSVSVEI